MSTTLPLPTPEAAPEKSPRGLFDALLCAMLLYGVYAATPLGAVAETGVRWAFGSEYRPSLFASFQGRETDVATERLDPGKFDQGALKATRTPPESVARAHAATGVDSFVVPEDPPVDTRWALQAPN